MTARTHLVVYSGALALSLTLAPAGGARAQSADIIAPMLGEWLVAPDDGTPGCRIRLDKAKTIGGMAATPARECATTFKRIADVASWSLADGGLGFNDATRKSVIRFEEDETAIWKTRNDAGTNYFLVQPRPGVDRAPHAPSIVGTWTMQRPNGPAICTVTFRDTPFSADDQNSVLSLDPSCDPAVKRLKLATWRVEDFALMLYGPDGQSLAFEPSATGFEKAASEKGRPLRLVKTR